MNGSYSDLLNDVIALMHQVSDERIIPIKGILGDVGLKKLHLRRDEVRTTYYRLSPWQDDTWCVLVQLDTYEMIRNGNPDVSDVIVIDGEEQFVADMIVLKMLLS